MPDIPKVWGRKFGGPAIEANGNSQANNQAARLCLVFAPGSRPDLAALEALASQTGEDAGPIFVLSHRGASGDWAELLAYGLTFDCSGLAPGSGDPQPPAGPTVGLRSMPAGEVISLAPGAHLAGGAGLIPVLRMLAGLGARLASMPGIAAVVWTPAGSWTAPELFQRSVAEWLGGGAFPALALTALEQEANGAMVSRGLGLLIGQELRVEPDKRLTSAAMARVAVRLIHELLQSGPLKEERDFIGPAGEHLLAVPVRDATELRIIVSAMGVSQ